MQTATLSEGDLCLIHALQIAPRMSWAEGARILGTTAATLNARWERLRSEGLAWVTAHPGTHALSQVIAFVEVDCVPGAQAEVARLICQDPRAASVDWSARGRDLMLTVMTEDLQSLTRFVLDELTILPGVQRQRTHLATNIYRQGMDWRLDALEPAQQQALEVVGRQVRVSSGQRPPANAWPLIQELGRDGRATAADLARATGRNPASVRRQLSRLLGSGILAFRCEVAQEASRWPLHCTWLARVPAAEQDRTAEAIATLPELRLCVTTTGNTNMMVSVWTRSQTDLMRVERLLNEKLPWFAIEESVINLRTLKRMGWMLDEAGRATGEVIVPTAHMHVAATRP